MPNGDDVMMTSESMSIRCPITQMIMKRPMKNRHCGHSYDYEGVEELIKQRTNKARFGQLVSFQSSFSEVPFMQEDKKETDTAIVFGNVENI